MEVIKINKDSVKRFLENLKNKQYMVCFVYYWFEIATFKRKMIDIAATQYHQENNRFEICCRGTSYLDELFIEDCTPEQCKEIILKYVHSFIECDEPKLS